MAEPVSESRSASAGKPSVESLKRASQISSKSSESGQEEGTSQEQKENPESCTQSKFKRTGSVQYRNSGWKSSQNMLERKGSSTSVKSNASGHEVMVKSNSKPREVPAKKSTAEQKAYLQQTFNDISNILKNCGINEDTLLKLKGK